MKINELIAQLQEIPNQEAEVTVDHWILATKTGEVILNKSVVTGVLEFNDGNDDIVCLATKRLKRKIQFKQLN